MHPPGGAIPDDGLLTLRAVKKNNILNRVTVAHDGAEALEHLFRQEQRAAGYHGGPGPAPSRNRLLIVIV